MSPTIPFDELLRRAREGDPAALEQLLMEHAPLLRAVARQVLANQRSTAYDSEDVTQSVFRTFCRRLREGRYDLNSPADLRRLLTMISRNKAIDRIRKERCERIVSSLETLVFQSREASPLRRLAARESLRLVWRTFNREERQLAKLRIQGQTWEEIAQRLGKKAAACRRQFDRALARVEEWLGGSGAVPE